MKKVIKIELENYSNEEAMEFIKKLHILTCDTPMETDQRISTEYPTEIHPVSTEDIPEPIHNMLVRIDYNGFLDEEVHEIERKVNNIVRNILPKKADCYLRIEHREDPEIDFSEMGENKGGFHSVICENTDEF